VQWIRNAALSTGCGFCLPFYIPVAHVSPYLFCALPSFHCGSCPWVSLALRVDKFTRYMSGNPLVRFWAPLCCQESDMIDVIFPTSKFPSV
jgi:hypothetical protein